MEILSKILPLIHSIHYMMDPDLNSYQAMIQVKLGDITITKDIEAETYADFNRKLTAFYTRLHTDSRGKWNRTGETEINTIGVRATIRQTEG